MKKERNSELTPSFRTRKCPRPNCRRRADARPALSFDLPLCLIQDSYHQPQHHAKTALACTFLFFKTLFIYLFFLNDLFGPYPLLSPVSSSHLWVQQSNNLSSSEYCGNILSGQKSTMDGTQNPRRLKIKIIRHPPPHKKKNLIRLEVSCPMRRRTGMATMKSTS